jgi:Asp-tRNA(Asn)/Glu-tRNA(Gln) amidotransferase A subunit family amidase
VGDFMVPLAFGNQTAGSHIRPGAYCGIAAFKPTHGTVDLRGIFELVPAFDTLGYYARSFDDIAAYYSVVRRVPRGPLADGLGRTPRIGIYHGLDQHAEPPALAAVESTAARLRALGATVEDMTLPQEFAALPSVHTRILHVVLSQSFAAIYPRHHNALSDILRGMIEDGMKTAPDTYAAAAAHADGCKSRINAAIDGYDALLLPSAPGEAPEGLGMTGSPIFQTMWTLLHVPCVTVPCGNGPKGLPLGVQLIGKRDDDETLLRLAKWFQTRM